MAHTLSHTLLSWHVRLLHPIWETLKHKCLTLMIRQIRYLLLRSYHQPLNLLKMIILHTWDLEIICMLRCTSRIHFCWPNSDNLHTKMTLTENLCAVFLPKKFQKSLLMLKQMKISWYLLTHNPWLLNHLLNCYSVTS